MSQITTQSKTVIKMSTSRTNRTFSQLTYDKSFINSSYSQNKVFTNVLKLDSKYPLSTFPKVQVNTNDTFGSSRKTTHYTIPQGKIPDLEAYSRSFVKALNSDLPGYEAVVLTKKAEFWAPKWREDDITYCNAVKLTASINHATQKIWITIILTALQASEEDNDEDDSDLEEEIQLRVIEPLLIPQPLEDSTGCRNNRRTRPAPIPSSEF